MLKRFSVLSVASLLALMLIVMSCSEEPDAPPDIVGPTIDTLPIPPIVVAVSPENDAVGVDPDAVIRIEFSHAMDPASINDSTILIDPEVPFHLTYNPADSTAVITPAYPLGFNTNYSVTVTVDVIDTDSLPLPLPYSWGFSTRLGNLLYVTQAGTGDGSIEQPMGSVQQALDSAEADPSIDAIYVAAGQYIGPLVIHSGADIYASRSPGNGWRLSEYDHSVINGGLIEGEPVAALIRDVSTTLTVMNLTIVGQDALLAGQSSYGVVCENSDRVRFIECGIRAGAGQDGVPGANGVAGAAADISGPSPGGEGGAGGYEVGGYPVLDSTSGGMYWVCGTIIGAEDGETGSCSDGSQTGGAGGTPGQDGESGRNGISGEDGQGGSAAIQLYTGAGLSLLTSGDGYAGTDGISWGCGGGGGGGGPTPGCGHASSAPYGADGGHGGAGGGPGTAGDKGAAGGSSVALFLVNSAIVLEDCNLVTPYGGNGGDAGTGGEGGSGEEGKPCVVIDFLNNGGRGGDGGDGGRGGHGGGGAGGASLGIVLHESQVELIGNVVFDIGESGSGGASAGNPGQDGLQGESYEIQ